MIYTLPDAGEPIDQGDLIDACPVALITHYQVGRVEQSRYAVDLHRVIVLTQTCDLAQGKTNFAVAASVYDAQAMIDEGLVKASDVKGPIRAGRTFGLYFLACERRRFTWRNDCRFASLEHYLASSFLMRCDWPENAGFAS